MGLVLFAHTVSLHRQGAVPPFGWDLAVYLASKDRPWFCRSPGFVSFAPSRFRNGMNAKPISTFTVARLRRIHTGFPCSARGKAGHKTYSAVRQKKKPHGQTSASMGIRTKRYFIVPCPKYSSSICFFCSGFIRE